MSRLLAIQDFVQQVVDAISAVIDADVVIIDDNISIVAGSGKYKNKIGFNYGKGSITQRLLNDNAFSGRETILVETPHFGDICRDCETKNECDITAALMCSVNYGTKVVGTLALFASNEKQKRKIIRKMDELSCFLMKMSSMISSKIGEKEMHHQASLMDQRFTTLIESLNEGIIVIDGDGCITQCNRYAPKMLKRSSGDLLGREITAVFPELALNPEMIEQGTNSIELVYDKNGLKEAFSGTVTPFDHSSGQRGGVISFRNIAKVRELPNRNIPRHKRISFADIKGSSKPMADIKERMARVASTDSAILLYGESGTGKELFAKAIHTESHRADGPFVAINCGAIPESLLESELFGYEDGAFTGAKRGGKPGKFEIAHGGTLFLDEIGDMPLHLQVKLLRVLQEKRFERVGGLESVWADTRLVTATNRNLEQMIKEGGFRNDLFYRISVIPFNIPPLRERADDVLVLAGFFLKKISAVIGKEIKGFDREAEDILRAYNWPGNVRELENCVEYAVNITMDQVITARSFPPRLLDSAGKHQPDSNQVKSLDDLERTAIVKALRQFGSNTVGKEKVARVLGISRATLYRKMKELEINKVSFS